MQRRSVIVLASLVALGTALVVVGCGGAPDASVPAPPPAEVQPSEGSHFQDPVAPRRTVVVVRGAEPAPSPSPTTLHAQLVRGSLPADSVVATVLTDEDCAPDAQGISHCTNALRLPDGEVLVVRHPHDMSVVPCLTPGERIELRPA